MLGQFSTYFQITPCSSAPSTNLLHYCIVSLFGIQRISQRKKRDDADLKQFRRVSLINVCQLTATITHTHTHTRLTALFPGLPGWAGTRKVKPIWILRKQQTVSGTSISWAIFKSAPRSRQITMPAPHHSVFYRPDALPAAQPTASKHWRQQR